MQRRNQFRNIKFKVCLKVRLDRLQERVRGSRSRLILSSSRVIGEVEIGGDIPQLAQQPDF